MNTALHLVTEATCKKSQFHQPCGEYDWLDLSDAFAALATCCFHRQIRDLRRSKDERQRLVTEPQGMFDIYMISNPPPQQPDTDSYVWPVCLRGALPESFSATLRTSVISVWIQMTVFPIWNSFWRNSFMWWHSNQMLTILKSLRWISLWAVMSTGTCFSLQPGEELSEKHEPTAPRMVSGTQHELSLTVTTCCWQAILLT